MVTSPFRGKGLQKLVILNVFLLFLDWGCLRYYISDVGYSSSGWRYLSNITSDLYPSLCHDTHPKKYHFEIVENMLLHHRADAGISSTAYFDSETFVIVGSNSADGGGAAALVPFTSTRISRRSGIAQRIMEELLEEEDEHIYVGYISLFRLVPFLLNIQVFVDALRWAGLFTLIGSHILTIPNLRWYYRCGFHLMGVQLIFPSVSTLPSQPCIWICNHFSFLDMWAVKILCPEVVIVAKGDLLDEAPPGFLRSAMSAAFAKCDFIYYDRCVTQLLCRALRPLKAAVCRPFATTSTNVSSHMILSDVTLRGKKDSASIRKQVREAVLERRRPVVIFAEGTSQRNGPPMVMYGGSIELARECNVPVQPVCLRFNLPLGLDKPDNVLSNASQLMGIGNKKLMIQPLSLMDAHTTTIEEVRAAITVAYHAAADVLNIPHRARGGCRRRAITEGSREPS